MSRMAEALFVRAVNTATGRLVSNERFSVHKLYFSSCNQKSALASKQQSDNQHNCDIRCDSHRNANSIQCGGQVIPSQINILGSKSEHILNVASCNWFILKTSDLYFYYIASELWFRSFLYFPFRALWCNVYSFDWQTHTIIITFTKIFLKISNSYMFRTSLVHQWGVH